MRNELLLIGSLAVIYGGVLLWLKLFGPKALSALLALATVLANIEVLLLVRAFGMEQTLGNVLFASTFLITDVLSETCGKREATRAANVGIAASAMFLIVSQSWLWYIPSENDVFAPALHEIFANTPRLLLSSLIVYAVCQRLDVFLYHRIWAQTEKRTGSKTKLLWLRNNAATLISQAVNCFAFNFAAFWNIYPLETLVRISLAGYVIFIVTSLLDTPFLYAARKIAGTHGAEAES